jgi:DHA1 family bicyclomycin/chloramphenicol resistance-like MFS transporter
MAIALRPFAHIAGTASALLGFIQMSLAAGASALVGIFLTTTPEPMVWMLLVLALISLLLGLRAHSLYARTKP